MRAFVLALSLATLPVATVGWSAPPSLSAAVGASTRTPDNMKLDDSRKPAQVLRFLGLRPGMQVLDLFGSNKYWSEIIAPAIGPRGHVTVWNPAQFIDDKEKAAFDEFAARQKNVDLVVSPFEAPSLPRNKFDFAILNNNYHDVYWINDKYKVVKMDPHAWLMTLNHAMKRGGIVGVIDHVASPNSDTRATVDKFHRIDPAVVRRDFSAAGFALVGASNILRNPKDDHSLIVFDPKIRGKTDRFIYKFKKVR